jgi:hypothetical protein
MNTKNEEEKKKENTDEYDKIKTLFNRWDMEDKAREVLPGGTPRPITFENLTYDKNEEYWDSVKDQAQKATGFILVTRTDDEKGATMIHALSTKDVAAGICFIGKAQPDAVALALPSLLRILGFDESGTINTRDRSDVKDLLRKLEGGGGGDSQDENPLVI